MQVVKEVPRETIERQFGSARDAKYFVRTPFEHYYLARLSADEFKTLLLNSSPTEHYPKLREFPTLAAVVRQFMDDPRLLRETHPWRGISGVTVAEYLQQFELGRHLRDCFVQEKPPTMPQPGSYFICDGMHRLVAYALHRQLDVEDFEVTVYYMTNSGGQPPIPGTASAGDDLPVVRPRASSR